MCFVRCANVATAVRRIHPRVLHLYKQKHFTHRKIIRDARLVFETSYFSSSSSFNRHLTNRTEKSFFRKCLLAAMVLRTSAEQNDPWTGQRFDLHLDEGGLSRGLFERTPFHLSFRRIQLRNTAVSLERFRSKNDRAIRAIRGCPGCRLFRKSVLER